MFSSAKSRNTIMNRHFRPVRILPVVNIDGEYIFAIFLPIYAPHTRSPFLFPSANLRHPASPRPASFCFSPATQPEEGRTKVCDWKKRKREN
jgi:hypothetical protein